MMTANTITDWLCEFAGQWLVQSTLLITIGLVIGRLLRRKGSAVQSAIYQVALVAALVVPLASRLLAGFGFTGWSLEVPVEPSPAVQTSVIPRPAQTEVVGKPASLPHEPKRMEAPFLERPITAVPETRPTPIEATRFHVGFAWCLLWGIVSSVLFIRLGRSVFQLGKLRRSASPADPGEIRLLEGLARRIGIQPPELLRSPLVTSACLTGLRRPAVLLPEEPMCVSMREVLAHELGHLRRRDCFWNLLRHAAIAIFFFQPLLWVLSRRIEVAAEEVCDDFVVESGADPQTYADRLLDAAESSLAPLGAGGIGMLSIRSLLGRRIERMLDGSRPLSTRMGRVLRMLVLAGGLATTLLAGMIGISGYADESTAAKEEKEKSGLEAPIGSVTKTLRGVLRDKDKQPLADAPVHLMAYHWVWGLPPGERQGFSREIAATRTDAEGRFELSAKLKPDYSEYSSFHVIATPPGYGITPGKRVNDLEKASAEGYEMVATSLMPIDGRILSPLGEPIQGAKVRLTQIWQPGIAAIGVTTGNLMLVDPVHSFWPGVVETDAEGRFHLKGPSAECLSTLVVEADGYAPARLYLATAELEREVRKLDDGSGFKSFGDPFRPYRRSFSHVLEPPRPFEGLVTDAESGVGISGVEVTIAVGDSLLRWKLFGKTDASGRYRINVPSFQHGAIRVYSSAGYIAYSSSLDGKEIERDFAENSVIKHDIKLTRGKLVQGTVVDADTGDAISGALVTYGPKKGNRARKRTHRFDGGVKTDRDGRFEIPALPGAGSLSVEVESTEYLRTNVSKNANPHGYIAVDIPDQDAWQAPAITIRKGKKVEVQVVGPDGNPIAELLAASRKIAPNIPRENTASNYRPYLDGKYQLRGVEPGAVYRTFFLSSDLKYGTFTDLQFDPEQPGPRVVRLQPTAIVRGRVVHADGKPAPSVSLFARYLITDANGDEFEFRRDYQMHAGSMANMTHVNISTDDDGNFEVRGVFPDRYISLSSNLTLAGGKRIQRVGKLKAGEIRDLGEMKLAR